MGSNVLSCCKIDYGAVVAPFGIQVTAKSVDTAFKVDNNEQDCPNCHKAEGLFYIKKNDGTFIFKCSLCKESQSRK
ncbi:hypothetical protein BGZ47_007091 [Haplosporangium gracile]|nr:hypothetical protein BGZ47_007091 [Haplosporangium gracile]